MRPVRTWEVAVSDVVADEFDPDFGHPTPRLSGPQSLCLAVMIRTCADARGDVAGLESMRPERRAAVAQLIAAEARDWLMNVSPADPHGYSVEDVCGALAIDHRALAAKVAAGHIPDVRFLACGVSGKAQHRMWRGSKRAARRAAQRGAA